MCPSCSSPKLLIPLESCTVVVGRTLSSEELPGDVEGFASNDDNLLAIEQLLCDCAGQTTEQVALAVNDNLIFVSPLFRCARLRGGPSSTYYWLEGRHLAYT